LSGRQRGGRRLKLVAGASLLASAVAGVSPALAQDGDPLILPRARNAITVTATRSPKLLSDVPATVTVIDEIQLADELVSDIKDLVRFEPGISVRRSPTRFGAALGVTGRDGNAGFNIRGLEGNRVLIQVDGVRVPDEFSFGAQASGRGDYVDLGLLKSVEILRGPASALYGSDGLAGAVSFITSDPEDLLGREKSFAVRGRASFDSSNDEFAENGIVAARSGDFSMLLAYTRRDAQELDNKGSNDAPNSTRTAPNPQDTDSNSILAKAVWAPNDAHRLRLTFDHLDARVRTNVLSGRAAVVSAPTSVLDLQARDRTRRDRVSFDWRYKGDGAIDFAQVSLWYQDGENRQFSAEDRNTAADRTRLNTFENRVIGASAELHSDFSTGSVTHRLIYGGDISTTRQQGVRDGTVPPAGETFPTRAFPVTDYVLAGAYVGDEIGFANGAFTLFPALRFDHYKLDPTDDPLLPTFQAAGQSGSRVSPKIGAVAKIGGGFSAFANYAQGFKAPSPTQVNQFFENLAFGYTSRPNPDLGPEKSESWEGGLRFVHANVSAGITGFTSNYRDFISQEVVSGSFTPSDPAIYQFINLNRVRIKGLEGKLEAKAASGLSARFAIGYATGTVVDGGGVRSPLVSIDPLKLVAGIGFDDPDGRFGGQLIMTHSARKELGRTRYQDGATLVSLCTDECYRPAGFSILDATAYAQIGEAFTLRAGLFNLLDKKYAWWSDVRGLAASSPITDAFTQPGRNVSVSLTARF
jgi:hemoglobin/transferrin/lactoferrin receptor protein